MEWTTTQNKTVTLRFQACDSRSLLGEKLVEVPRDSETTTTTYTSGSGSTPSTRNTTTTTVKRKVRESHWKINVKHSLVAFAGTDTVHLETIAERESSTVVVTGGGRHRSVDGPPGGAPIPAHTDHPAVDLNITWLLRQLRTDERSSVECDFSIDRSATSARTPRRNVDIDQAVAFQKRVRQWATEMEDYFVGRIENVILGKHSPVLPDASGAISTGAICNLQNLTRTNCNGKQVAVKELVRAQNRYRVELLHPSDALPSSLLVEESELARDSPLHDATSLRGLSCDSVFCPVQPLAEEASVLRDTDAMLAAHEKQLDNVLEKQAKHFPPKHPRRLISIAEAVFVVICRNAKELALHYFSCVEYLEQVMFKQLVKAIGKEVTSSDFSSFVRHHGRRFFDQSYLPRPFSYAVRQPGHAPDGLIAIESRECEPIDTIVRHVPAQQCAAPLEIPLNAASTVQMTGDRYLHGWMIHQFAGDGVPKSFSLSARARQFSSFMLVIGSMSGSNQLEPKHAIILQNKDDLLIPILMEALPSAKDFKNATSSLSPEQREFANAYRAMQLGTSVFGVAIIRLKPQLENLLGLLLGSLTKEIQLTQDLLRLFVDYQIPSDLLSFDGPADTTKAERLTAVKEHVKAVLLVITEEKEKIITAEEQRADYRQAVKYGFVGGGGGRFTPHAYPLDCEEEEEKEEVVEEFEEVEEEEEEEGGDGRRRRGSNYCNDSWDFDDDDEEDIAGKHDGGEYDKPNEQVSPDEDFTLLPKELDAVLERMDTDNALCSTKLKAATYWQRQRQENILAALTKKSMNESDIEAEKKTAFDLLDAISRSGALPIDSAELHVIVCLSHCFEKDVMGTAIQDNINPITKAEKSALLLASAVHRVSPAALISSVRDRHRLQVAFPLLFDEEQGLNA